MERTTCFEEYAVRFSYGHGRLRFVKPDFISDTIHSRVTIAAKEDDPERPAIGRVMVRTEVINRRDEVVPVVDHIHIVERKNKLA